MYKIHPRFSKPKVYKTKINPNSMEFYRKHPDLAPRNVYLYLGRTVDLKTVERYIANFGKESIWDKVRNWFSNIFNKNK